MHEETTAGRREGVRGESFTLEDLPGAVTDPEICGAYAADASGLSRVPDAVVRPQSEDEVRELLRVCSARGIAVTPQGLRSSTTGASVPARGIVVSLERMARVLSIDPQRRVVVAEPGIVASEFKARVREAGLFYPVDPTSEAECTLGGTVACNASGSRTYRYGPTRGYVRALRVVLADGSVREVRRISSDKNSTGYAGLQNPVDIWIGSEGTLGVVTQVELDLLLLPPGVFGALAFFRDWRAAVGFVQAADASRRVSTASGKAGLRPRCLELFDHGSLDLVRPDAGGLRIPAAAGAAVFFEEEVSTEESLSAMERWYAAIEEAEGLADDTVVAQSEAEQAELKRLRHALPAGMNERGARAVSNGGRKVSTDFAVPLDKLPQMMEEAYTIVREIFGGFHVAYGHAGNGHPHFNLLAEDAAGLTKAREAARRMAERALDLGGTMAAEHGIGKVKSALYRRLYPVWLVEASLGIKRALDPQGILSPGNIFGEDEI
jgi:FAD/FMN-containing dehydrogenase